MPTSSAEIVVTGANGFVGARICEVLAERGAPVRAVVRRAGTAPDLPGVAEVIADFTDPSVAALLVSGATSVITTVHPMGSDRATQARVGVKGTVDLAWAASAAGVERFIHVSTAGVYDRSPGVGDVSESSALVGDEATDYQVTKRDADRALADVAGITRVLLRPPAILGPGETSTWNAVRPVSIRESADNRHAVAHQTFAWVHVKDLALLAADLATGQISDVGDPESGPVAGACVALNVAAAGATQRDYYSAVTGALGVDPVWDDGPAWTGQILADRAHAWGWYPTMRLADALEELIAGLSAIIR
jgi:nucleoside-diphosphate-sugar epimerase